MLVPVRQSFSALEKSVFFCGFPQERNATKHKNERVCVRER